MAGPGYCKHFIIWLGLAVLPVVWQYGFAVGEDPEINMSVPQIIAHNGYPVEEHFVTTEDGYILGVHRIPYGREDDPNNSQISGRPVAFLHHGLLCSSSNWVINLRNESLGFLLADAGFDVWLANSRGNTYSTAHVNLSVHSDAFWAFSWDDMASKDLPAVMNHILNTTKQADMYYVGHSQGTMIAFAEFSHNFELAKKVKMHFALGPVTTVGAMTSPIKYFAPFVSELKYLFKVLGLRDFMPQSWVLKWLASFMCSKSLGEKICANVVFIICGYDKPQMNETRLDIYTTHSPAGTSSQNIIHYAQSVSSKKFEKYDYGEKGNWAHYNQSTPPQYNIENYNVPTVLYSGGNDWLADPTDVELLMKKLKNNVVLKHQEIKDWMHLDFIWGMDAPQLVYYDIIKLMKEDYLNSRLQ